MKQALVTRKNRKLRKLRERYPDIRIKLFYRRDIERLAQRFRLDLASLADDLRVGETYLSAEEIQRRVGEMGPRSPPTTPASTSRWSRRSKVPCSSSPTSRERSRRSTNSISSSLAGYNGAVPGGTSG